MTDRLEAFVAGVLLCCAAVLIGCAALKSADRAHTIMSGEWVYVTPVFTHICCDCNLTHVVTVIPAMDGNGYYTQWVVDKKKTERLRLLSRRRLRSPWEEP